MTSNACTAGRGGPWFAWLACCALTALTACDSSDEVLAAMRPVRFEAREISDEVLLEREPIVLQSFTPESFEFAAESGRLDGDVWRPQGDKPAHVTLHGEFPLDRIDRVVLQLDELGDTRVRVAFRAKRELLGVLDLPQVGRLDGAGLIDVPPELTGTADELVLAVSRFDPDLEVGGVQLLERPVAARMPLPGAGLQLVTVGNTARMARGLSSVAPLRASADFAVGDELRFAVACLGAGGASVEFVARQDDTEFRRVLDLTDDERWMTYALRFEDFEDGPLEFSIQLASGAPCAVSDVIVVRPQADPPTVVLITSDTHRGDHLGFLENGALVETPNLDALAARGTVFVDARSLTHITNPSHVSLFTGVHPYDHGILDNQTPLTPDARTLAEIFRSAGWATLAATSAGHLGPERSGLGQGFDAFVVPEGDKWQGFDPVGKLQELLPEADGRPAFLWLHVFDAHQPFRPSARWRDHYADPERDPYDPTLPEPLRHVAWDREIRDLEYVTRLYRAEVSQADERLGAFLDEPRLRDAWIAFTGDHGERLDVERAFFGHRTLDPESLHVPLILVGDGVPPGVSSAAEVTNQDLGRTLLDLAGFDVVDFPGRNLLDVPSDLRTPRFAVARYAQSASVESEGWMFVRHILDQSDAVPPLQFEAGQEQLFHIAEDRECRRDLIDIELDRAAALRARLDALLESGRELHWGVDRAATPAELMELRALGYAGN